MSARTEYRAIIQRGGREYDHAHIFPQKDVNWEGTSTTSVSMKS